MSIVNCEGEEPEFISFLFTTKSKHDFHFIVGNEDHMEPEKIGVVKAMLMAHSTVLRLQLEDSQLADKEKVAVPDIYPDTFRNLLRYVYGHDTTASLNFNEADNLFYVAVKYMMSKLKNKLATKLMGLLNTENICSLLNNPAVYTELELDNAITKILRYETDKVLASPLFLDISCSGFVKILEQDGLNVPEIELWRAALKWAKHKDVIVPISLPLKTELKAHSETLGCTIALDTLSSLQAASAQLRWPGVVTGTSTAGSEDGKQLRNQMSSITQHIRICTLSTEQFCQEVIPTRVLSNDEVVAVGMAIGKQEKQDDLSGFSNEMVPRGRVSLCRKKQHRNILKFNRHKMSPCMLRDFTFEVITKKCVIELLPMECLAHEQPQATPEGATYPVGCSITITRDPDYTNNTSVTEPPVTVRFNKQVIYGTTFEIPLTSNGRNVTLLPNSMYTISMVFDGDQRMYYDYSRHYGNNHLSLYIQQSTPGWHYIPMNHLAYQTDAE